MAKKRKVKVKYLTMLVRSDEHGEKTWHIIDGRRVFSTGLRPEDHVAARRVFQKYSSGEELLPRSTAGSKSVKAQSARANDNANTSKTKKPRCR